MVAITFDTLKFVDTLEKAQMPREQARAIAEAVQSTYEVANANVATKTYVDSKFDILRAEMAQLRAEMAQFRAEMETRFIQLELRLTIRMGVIVTAVMGVFTAIIKLT